MILRSSTLLAMSAIVAALAAPSALAQPGPDTPPPQNAPQTQPPREDDAPRRVDPRAVELGEQVIKRLREARTLRLDLNQALAMRSGEMGRQEMESAFELAMERPNKFALKLTQGMMGETVVSDGEKLYTHLPALNAYLENDAPDEMDDLLVDILGTGGGMGGGPLTFLAPILVGPEGKRNVRHAEYKGEEELEERTVHRVHYVIEPSLPDELAEEMQREMGDDFRMTYVFDAWIDAERPIVHKIEFDLGEMMKDMIAQMPEEMRDIEYEMVMTFKNWRIDEDVPADRFAFSPPEGTRKVDSIMEAFGRMDEGPGPGEALLGRPAPDFELASLDAGTVSLAQHRGRDIVILDFWATWCPPCVKALPGLMEVAEEYSDRNVILYAVNQRESGETIRKFLEERNWDLRVPLDPEGEVATKYHVRGIPQTVVIDKQGTVQAVHIGYSPELKDQLRSELDTLLEGRTLAPPLPETDDDDDDDDEENDERDAPGTR